jgi:oligosaccharide repeat unit polymerase
MSWNFAYFLAFFGICQFGISYYRNCYRRGYKIDIWHWTLFIGTVFPIMIMLPFAKNELNAIIVGQDFAGIVEVLPMVFFISMVGYFSTLLGGLFWRLHIGLGIRKATRKVLGIIPECSMMLMSSRSILVFQSAICIFLQFAILAIYFSKNGFGFDLRGFTFENPALRPIALLISNYSMIIASHCIARYVDYKEKILLACALFLLVGLVFFGARANIAAVFMDTLLCYIVSLRSRVNLLRISALFVVILLFAFYLGNLRAQEYSLSVFGEGLVFAIFFGNNFSDLRDFAWVYSKWDHQLWGGKTYLAAVTAFVPRFASKFRDTWAVGVVADTTIGLDPQIHPGVRPGGFGEGFFNFGFVGVIIVGVLVGVILRRADQDVKEATAPPQSSIMRAFAATTVLRVAGFIQISGNFTGMYVLGGVYLFTWLCLKVQEAVQPRSLSHA